jgi:hypothetical protein
MSLPDTLDFRVEQANHFSAGFPMLSQFSVFPPLSESAQEVLSYVCPASRFHQIAIECRMVICQFDLAGRQTSAALLGTSSDSQKLGKNSNLNDINKLSGTKTPPEQNQRVTSCRRRLM